MPSRRQLLLASGGLSLLSGCTELVEPDATVESVEVELANGETEAQEFHVALETDEGLGEWQTWTVPPETRRTVTLDSPTERVPAAVHGVVGNEPVRASLGRIDFGSETVCLRFVFYYHIVDDDEVELAEIADISCE
ncbi:hypothetical protein SAMN04487949_0682 [Halogranum gelatinilyticum]|uniref:Uncharacterized protein n=1 Tax=Halogranum gelatinilyticum TaxID=660521 RepID=A0A1G9Q483_9EURY|nr:hypothetical protein [Halogranum gelatinilyticum]SDM05848.1 hypothetical protein SAMN04487949_0682 [Halogranum gelatinilyticum]